MEDQGTSNSDTQLDFVLLPNVPFLRVLSHLPGPEIEKCRGVSRLFRKRIDTNRKWLPPVQVYSLTIQGNDDDKSEPTFLITLEKDDEEPLEIKYKAASLEKALEKCDHMFPRVFIGLLHLKLDYFDDSTFHLLLEKFSDIDIKCRNLFLATPGQKFQLDDLRALIRQLKPENLLFKNRGENNVMTSTFWEEDFIRDSSQLYVHAASHDFFDDQVLLNLTQSTAIIREGCSACTFEGFLSFLKQWKAGIRELNCVVLVVRATILNTNAVLARLPWNVESESVIEMDQSSFTIYLMNSLGKKIEFRVRHWENRGSFAFGMRETSLNAADGGILTHFSRWNDEPSIISTVP